jgi:arylsulfatase
MPERAAPSSWPDGSRPVRISADETFEIGEDTGTPVSREYDAPFRFTDTIRRVTVELASPS